MMYRITTGWYPSKNTADKVLTKVKSVVPNAEIISSDVFYSISCGMFVEYEVAHAEKKRLLERGVYCGVEAVGGV